MERQFAEFMVQQMEKTVHKNDKPSSAENYYNSLLTSKRVDKMSQSNGGIGIQKMILDQIYPTRLRNKLAYDSYNIQQDSMIRTKSQVEMKENDQIKIHQGKESL